MKYEDKKDIRGAGGGGKGGGGDFRAPVEAPNTLRSRQYAKVLDLVSEGEIEGLVNGARSVFLDDTPLQNDSGSYNFQGVTLVERTGTQGQSYIPGFAGVESEKAVAVEVTNALPVVRSITNTNATAARVTIGIPRLTKQDTTTGDLNGTSVTIAIDVQNNGGGYVAQALRKIYRSNVFSVGGGIAQNTLASSSYRIEVKWTGEQVLAPQTCTIQLQYRAVGDSTWLVAGTHTFSGGSFSNSGNFNTISTIANPPTYPSGTKTFSLTLAEDEYQFRVVKTNGSRQQATQALGHWILTTPLTGTAYGGTAAFGLLEAYAPEFNDIISGKTTSKYQRAYRIELPSPGPWDIRVRRITADSTSSAIVNNTWWDSYTEIVDAKLTYPNSAIYALQIDSKQFNQIPTRGYELNGIKVKVPSNYDPLTREYTGTWDGTFQTAWSDNPAWVFYDIITNDRYGLGELVPESMMDKWGLYTIAQYCDTMVPDGFGGYEPRFTCNLYLQTREAAASVISAMASVFRGIAYWSAGGVQVAQDAPKDVEQLFTPANVVDGMFSYSGSASKTRHTVVLVSWNDPQDGYKQKIEYVEDAAGIARYGVVQTEVLAVGCTSRGQAHRFGRSIIYTELQEMEVVSFKAGLDSVYVQPGSIISIQDPTRAGKRFGGRILGYSGQTLYLDFAGTKTLDPRITFTRASSGSYYNEFGRLVTAAANVPRFDHDPVTSESLGLLIEEQRTNLTFPSTYTSANGFGANVVVTEGFTAPDNTTTATSVKGTAASTGEHGIGNRLQSVVTDSIATAVCGSVFIKAVTASAYNTYVFLRDHTSAVEIRLNLSFDAIGALTLTGTTDTGSPTNPQSGIQDCGNGWYRVWASFTVATTGSAQYRFFCHAGTVAGNETAYWGAQVEEGAFPSSYIATAGSQVTRAVDSAVMTGTNFSDWYNATEGTLFVEGSGGYAQARLVVIGDNSVAANCIQMAQGAVNFNQTMRVSSAAVAELVSANAIGTRVKAAQAYKLNDWQAAFNGTAGAVDTSCPVPVVDRMGIGSAPNLTLQANGHIKRIAYYPRRLSEAQLQALTS